MSFEVFEKLEAKVQQAVDTITLLQMEIEELKDKNNHLAQEVQNARAAAKRWSRKTISCVNSSMSGRNAFRRCWVKWKKCD
ncbi:putative cytoplasmic protein [Cronobacter dublinensis 1210]|uniref:Cytoplasmic protein n=1 Tax=Cronobacter dublinensis 1210 TaxID=1208656 RepID=A0ABM9QAU4_9ENTR|nr:putative cytoplasmic protein [Cronobacter dublinensis 1210]